MPSIWMAFGVIVAYLLGSIPTGYWLVKAIRGMDIRQYGSGNIGATNVRRVLGWGWGNTVLIIDIAKGTVAVVLAKALFFVEGGPVSADVYKIVCAIAAVCGHNWTIFLGFHGGKGVATSAGALLGLAPSLFLASLVVWGAVAKVTGYVSVASIAAGLAFCAFTFLFNTSLEMKLFGVVMAVFFIVKHRTNIRRLMQGTEPKMGKGDTRKADNAVR